MAQTFISKIEWKTKLFSQSSDIRVEARETWPSSDDKNY